jgi:hypothetical protein
MSTSKLVFIVCLQMLMLSCNSYQPKPNGEAGNTIRPTDIVIKHFRAVEDGDWAKANSYIAEDYKMKMEGMPFFISIKKENALDMHKARKRAFPDFRFNEEIEYEKDNQVKIAVYFTETLWPVRLSESDWDPGNQGEGKENGFTGGIFYLQRRKQQNCSYVW